MVSFLIDGAIVISALSKIGLINNFHNIEDDTFRVTRCDDSNVYAMERIPGNTCIFIINNDGRIISLNLEDCYGTDNKGYVLPAIISSLEKMTELRLGICRSLPLELSNMPQLKTLRFFDSRILLSDFPGQLKQLGSKPLLFLTWITKQLPNLEGLGFKSLKRNELEFIIDSLRKYRQCALSR